MKEVHFTVCPLCGLNRKLDKTGMFAEIRKVKTPISKGRARYDKVDLKNIPFIDIREGLGGRGRGFPRIKGITLKEAQQDPLYEDLIKQIISSCQKILKILS